MSQTRDLCSAIDLYMFPTRDLYSVIDMYMVSNSGSVQRH